MSLSSATRMCNDCNKFKVTSNKESSYICSTCNDLNLAKLGSSTKVRCSNGCCRYAKKSWHGCCDKCIVKKVSFI